MPSGQTDFSKRVSSQDWDDLCLPAMCYESC